MTNPDFRAMFTARQITDHNAINGLANEIEGHLLRILSPWQGLEVRKVSGNSGYVAKLQAELDRYCADHSYNVKDGGCWLNIYASYTTLLARVSVHSSSARPVVIHLGGFDGQTGILTRLNEGIKRRTDYTLSEVEAALAKASQLEAEARELRSSVSDLTTRR
jgi:hypothetical protein